MEKINEIKLPKGVNRIAVKQHDDRIVIEFIPKEAEFKRGDILVPTINPGLTVIFDKMTSITTFDSIYHNGESSNRSWWLGLFRHATKEEKQEFFDKLKADGKRWNAEKLIVEDIPQPKFKIGDKVRIKDGISSKTHKEVSPSFNSAMDKFIGKELTVQEYTDDVSVVLFEDYIKFHFREDWLEPWSEEPKNGDLAIFWDNDVYKEYASVRLYDRKGDSVHYGSCHYDSCGISWRNAIKFESKEQFEKVLRGEI